jgi:hypothetical protein
MWIEHERKVKVVRPADGSATIYMLCELDDPTEQLNERSDEILERFARQLCTGASAKPVRCPLTLVVSNHSWSGR